MPKVQLKDGEGPRPSVSRMPSLYWKHLCHPVDLGILHDVFEPYRYSIFQLGDGVERLMLFPSEPSEQPLVPSFVELSFTRRPPPTDATEPTTGLAVITAHTVHGCQAVGMIG